MCAQAPALPDTLQASLHKTLGTLTHSQGAAAAANAAAERAFALSLR